MTQPDLSRGACADVDPDVMTPETIRGSYGGTREQIEEAKSICRWCPVLEPCRAWGIEASRYVGGIVGGLTQPERLRLSGARSGKVPRPTWGHR